MSTPPVVAPVLDVVVPVHNEQHTVAACVRRLHEHLVQTFPYPFRITVADNASTDATVEVASGLVAELPGVAVARLDQKGRGRALKAVWLASDAPILAYMDVDLSTDLDALWPLVAPLMSGHSDLAIGSRLARGSRVVRGSRREVVSRCYNLLLRGALGARFTDAQCGFKAIRADVAAELLPLVEDTTWFFDTELLVLAERSGLRIHEVPVDWFDDPDSRVDVVGTAMDDLRGVRRLRRALASGQLPLDDIARRIGRGTAGRRTWQQLQRFAVVGVVSTVVHLGLFAALRSGGTAAQSANLVALLVATVANTALNRRWTFGVQGRGAFRHQAQGLALFGVTWLLTAGGLGLLHLLVTSPPTVLQTTVVAAATALSTAVRFVAMRTWMFRAEPQSSWRVNVPEESSNTTMPVQSKPSTEPWHTVTSP
ncbi:bifunctional glycosyltransferase family 2/GtrA family protein [Pedococcus ginsenosidimutans]|uniref:dolichyl-phosphate beta-glucosyltransferase n=1 Tax=Pedococcus ginsenosidimutans TaxID=490570 RepID=A0ABP8XSZ2_9MICO